MFRWKQPEGVSYRHSFPKETVYEALAHGVTYFHVRCVNWERGLEATVHASHSIVKTTLPGRLSDYDACVTELGAALTCPSSREAGWLVHHARKLQLILILECRRCLHQLQEETANPANEMSRGEPPVGVNWPLADTQISSM